MNKLKPVVMILVDALPYNHLSQDNTPFLHLLSQKSYSSDIEPLFAYRGIESTIFTGNNPNKHKIWTEYCLNEEKLLEKNTDSIILRNIIKFLDIIPNDLLSGFSRNFLYKSLAKKELYPAMIPADLLNYFKMSQKPIICPNSLIFTLFDFIRDNDMSFNFVAPPFENKDQIIFEKVMDSTDDKDFWFIKFGMFDYIGHKFGPESKEAKYQLKTIDKYIEKIYFKFKKEYPEFTFVVLSDHGMAKVTKEVNIIDKLKKIKLSVPEDYIYFIDSTMIRFWFFNSNAEKIIHDLLYNLNMGHFLTANDLKRLNIDKIGKKYGDMIFVLDDGYVFCPDFFRKNSKPKGMHGYMLESSLPVLIIDSPNVVLEERKVKFEDILPTILEIMNLSVHNSFDGFSLIKK